MTRGAEELFPEILLLPVAVETLHQNQYVNYAVQTSTDLLG